MREGSKPIRESCAHGGENRDERRRSRVCALSPRGAGGVPDPLADRLRATKRLMGESSRGRTFNGEMPLGQLGQRAQEIAEPPIHRRPEFLALVRAAFQHATDAKRAERANSKDEDELVRRLGDSSGNSGAGPLQERGLATRARMTVLRLPLSVVAPFPFDFERGGAGEPAFAGGRTIEHIFSPFGSASEEAAKIACISSSWNRIFKMMRCLGGMGRRDPPSRRRGAPALT